MTKRWIMGWFVLVFSFSLAGTAGANNEAEELRKMLQEQYKLIQEMEKRLQEIEKKQAKAPEVKANDFRAYWDEGLRLETADKDFQMRIGGRLHIDGMVISGDDDMEAAYPGQLKDGTQFRRARLDFRGTIYKYTDFRLQLDFAGAKVAFKDAYVAFRNFPGGALQVGQFKEPFSLEELASSNDLTFLERALPNAFAPSRNIGIQLSNNAFDQMMTWAGGVFRETSDDSVTVHSDQGYNFTGRLTFNPLYRDQGRHVVHLGAAFTHKTTQDNDQLRYRQRPEAHQAPRFVDTNTFLANSVDILGLEAAWVFGPFSLQGEYMVPWVSGKDDQTNVSFSGYYLQASYWLTGEHRSYSRRSGVFTYVRPKSNLMRGGGWGGWEVAARYSHIDLTDKNIKGGRLNDFTAGLNWHLNPNSRMMFNYTYADDKQVGRTNIYQARLQVHF